jgi:ABC-type transport system substrate-binding protein
MYPYNPEEAKRLLKELGYDAQHPLQFTILVSNHDSTLADIAALVKTQLAKIGVEAKINLMDLTAVIDRFVVKHDFDMTVNSFADLLDINMRSVSFFKGAPGRLPGYGRSEARRAGTPVAAQPGTQQASGHQCGHPAPAG